MLVFTPSQVAEMTKGSVIPAPLAGICHMVFAPKDRDKMGDMVTEQLIILKEGNVELSIGIESPEHHGGVIPDSAKGKKIYLHPGTDGRGKPCGLVRGGDSESNGRTRRYVNLWDKPGCSWSFQDGKPSPQQATQQAPQAPQPQEDNIPMEYGTPPPRPAPTRPQVSQQGSLSHQPSPTTQPDSASALQTARFLNILDMVIDELGRQERQDKFEIACGTQPSAEDVRAIAATIYIQASR